jgi:uncharacterized membrane protein YdfJ with MMPL/SSD domain
MTPTQSTLAWAIEETQHGQYSAVGLAAAGRVREGVDRGLSTDDAVRQGIAATAETVTSAAVVMVAVFSIFATLGIIDMKEMGVGLAVAAQGA